MKLYLSPPLRHVEGRRSVAVFILDLEVRSELIRRVGGPRRQSGRFVEEKNFLLLPRYESLTVQPLYRLILSVIEGCICSLFHREQFVAVFDVPFVNLHMYKTTSCVPVN